MHDGLNSIFIPGCTYVVVNAEFAAVDISERCLEMNDEEDLLLLFMLSSSEINNNTFRNRLSDRVRRRRHRWVPRIALLDPNVSTWVKLYSSGSESAMITLASLDYPSFHFLAVEFEILYNRYTPYSRNGKIMLKHQHGHFCQPRCLDSRGCLAMVLAFLITCGGTLILSMLFGITGSVVSLFLRFGWRLLIKFLKSLDGAKVLMPSLDEIKEFKQIVVSQYPSLQDVWFVVDGLKLTLEHPRSGNI
jgi:hypothetical protein